MDYSIDVLDTNECMENNGGCEHSCTNEIGTFACSCDSGYELDSNMLNCTSEHISYAT